MTDLQMLGNSLCEFGKTKNSLYVSEIMKRKTTLKDYCILFLKRFFVDISPMRNSLINLKITIA